MNFVGATTPTPAVMPTPGVGAVGSTARWMILVVTFAILSVGVPAVLLAQVGNTARSAGWIAALALMSWCGLRLAILLTVGDARFFAFFFWLFTYIFMGVAPAVQIRSNQPSITTSDVLPSRDLATVGIVILGVLCYEIGTLFARLSRPPSTAFGMGQSIPKRLRPSGGVRPVVTWALAGAGLVMTLYYIATVGRGALFASREAAAAARAYVWPDVPTRAIIGALAIYPLLIAIGGLVQLRHANRWWLARIAYGVAILGGSAVLLVAVNPISSARYTLGTVVFALLVLFGAAATRFRVRLSMAGLVFGLFFLFPLADAFRIGVADFSRAGFFGEYGSNPDYDSIWQVANAMTLWQSDTQPPGFQALGLVSFWIPRTIWPGKPLDTGIVLANFNGYGVTNLSAPLWAEAIVNGGLVVLTAVFLLLGYLLRRFDDRVIRALAVAGTGAAPGVWLIVGAAFPAYFMILLRGSLLQATGAVVVIIACLLLVWKPGKERPTKSVRFRAKHPSTM